MLIIPAIDLRGGSCVRLRQGDYARETVYGDVPAEIAQRWVEQGASFLHLVDLDAAKTGMQSSFNLSAVQRIIRTVGVPCQMGGGIRDDVSLERVFDYGVQRAVIGTQALIEPEWFERVAQKYPGRLLLGLDAKDGMVATEGWLKVSECPAIDLAKRFEKLPLAGIVYTDISRDGMLVGPNFGAIKELAAAVELPVIASGGVSTLGDIRLLNRLPIAACIVGRALYEGTLNLKEAIELIGRR